MAIDKEKIRFHVRGLIEALGDDPDRAGLIETPDRVARMYEEVFEGMNYSNAEIARMFGKTFDVPCGSGDMVLIKDIEIFSYCEHHLALMYDMTAAVAYIPKDKVLGLSKIARICDMAARRLQLQEKLGADISEIIMLASGTDDVAVAISGSHSCMTARGIRKPHSRTSTVTLRGKFETDGLLQNRFFSALERE